jgi:tRNA A-37 threonylcarbamoyl transferase component Bud32
MAQLKCSHCGFVNAAQKKSCQKCGTPLPRVSVGSGSKSAKDPDQFRRGQIVAARYTVMDLIGRGGMACIYKVQDNTLKEAVALKTMLPEFTKEKALVDRFYNEAKIARQLTHPNIVRVHDIGMADGVMYISMELLVGRSLRGVLDGLQPGQRLPVKTALRIMDQLCAALDYAHEYTIHRDIKPENVMVLNDGTVKLMDFGISKLRADSSLTATSMVMGTPHYMSPEQLKDSRNVDARTDVYSMGVLLYEVMTGNIPTGVPKPASQIMKETPPDIDRIIGTCMEPDPISRYQSIQELRTAIRSVLDVVESNTTAQQMDGKKPAPKKKTKVGIAIPKWAVGVVMIIAIALASGVAIWKLDERRQRILTEPSAAALAPLRIDPYEADYRALTEDLRALQPLAMAKAGDDEFAKGILNTATVFGNRATSSSEAGRNHEAIKYARNALACYLGILTCPEDALFVGPGIVDIGEKSYEVDAFYIEKESVTARRYFAFVQDVEPAWKSYSFGAGEGTLPATFVTFYDAQMYASHYKKRLPTYVEWKHALASRGKATVSSVGFWTQSRVGGNPHAVLDGKAELDRLQFGAELMTCQAYLNGEDLEFDEAPMYYDAADAIVGIRCVWPVPLDMVSVELALATP